MGSTRRVFHGALVIAALTGVFPHPTRADPRHTVRGLAMNEATETAIQALQLPDEAFHSASDAPFDRVIRAIAPDLDAVAPDGALVTPPVFALGLPRVVDVERDPTIPGVLALRLTVLRRWEVDFEQNLCFVIVDLHTGVVRTVTPMLPDKRMSTPEPSRSGPEPTALDRVATIHGVERFTLAPAFGPDWPSTAYAVTAIYYDMVTNTAVVERRPRPDIEFKPARAPSDFIRVEAPGASVRPGFAMTVPASVPRDRAIPIEGRVVAPRGAVALVEFTEEPDALLMVADLLLVQLDISPPRKISIAVPAAVTGDTVSAAFSFDLASRLDGLDLAGEYQVYLVSGRSVAGPAALTVTPP